MQISPLFNYLIDWSSDFSLERYLFTCILAIFKSEHVLLFCSKIESRRHVFSLGFGGNLRYRFRYPSTIFLSVMRIRFENK